MGSLRELGLKDFHPNEILLRGRSMVATTRIQRVGIPLDVPTLQAIKEHLGTVCLSVAQAAETENKWGIYNGAHFTMEGYVKWLVKMRIGLPKTPKTEMPTTKTKVLEEYEPRYPELEPLRRCMQTLDTLSKFRLEADADGRSRPFTRPYCSVTGRNQPGSTEFVFSLPKWFRHLIKPQLGEEVFYSDAYAQEVLIGAMLSGCKRMLQDYMDGDVHMALAIRLGLAPTGATKHTHKAAREQGKTLLYGTNYGQGEWGLAGKLGCTIPEAKDFLRLYRETYPEYFNFRQSNVNGLMRRDRYYFTKLGWPYWPGQPNKSPRARARGMMNHPIQSHGSDWLRIVLIAGTESGLRICASVHDGLLVSSAKGRVDEDAERMALVMKAASVKLFGVPMTIDTDIVREGCRFVPSEKHARDTWALVTSELQRIQRKEAA
jgi:DNA polymerase-1